MDEDTIRRRELLQAAGVVGALGAASEITAAEPVDDPGPSPDRILVGSAPEAPQSQVEATAREAVPVELEVVKRIEQIGCSVIELPTVTDERVRENVKDQIASTTSARYVEDDYTISLTPNDPYYEGGNQYTPDQVGAPKAWDRTLGDSDVTIAIVDTGTKYTHPDLQGNVTDAVSNHGYDQADDDGDPAPDKPVDEYHGTHVAGIAGAVTDNDEGVAGISECSLLCCRVLDESGSGSYADIADGIVYAADQGADVINMSLGGPSDSTTLHDAVQYAVNNGALPIAAAGNDSKEYGETYDGTVYHQYPAEYPECMAVSAVDETESFADFSSFGEEVDVTAPGVGVVSSFPQEAADEYFGTGSLPYALLDGTSMASPVVAGVAGLTMSQFPSMSNDEVRDWIEYTADDIGLSNKQQGNGQVNAASSTSVPPHNHMGSTWTGTTDDGWVMRLVETSSSGTSRGLRAESGSTDGTGVQGVAGADTGRTYGVEGVSNSDNGVGVRGRASSSSGTTFGVLGTAQSPDGRALQGTNFATSGKAVGLGGRSDSSSGRALEGRAKASSGENYGVYGKTNSSSGYGVYGHNVGGGYAVYSDGDLHVQGDFTASGTKNFVQTVSTDAGPKEVAYTAVEADEAHTETSGVATLEDGRAVVELPDHFQMVTSESAELVVQTTPHGADADGPAVVERSPEQIVIEDLEGTGEYEVSYTVRGTRDGYEDEQVVREPDSPSLSD